MASSDALPGPRRPRPLSPHLSVYRFTITMAMSIAHRISGMALYVGVLLLAWFLIATSTDAATFAVFAAFIQSFIGRLVLFAFTWALFHHLVGGIRHIVSLDFGKPARPLFRSVAIFSGVRASRRSA